MQLSEVSDRLKLFGPDIRRLERMFDGFERIRLEGLECLKRRDRAGAWARLNALILGLPVLALQLAYLATASHAEDAGVVTIHWMGMLGSMRAGTEPILDSMVGFDVRRMETAAMQHGKELVELQEALPRFQKSMLVGARWTEKSLVLANGVVVAASVYDMAEAFESMGGGPGSSVGLRFPALAGAGASGGVVVLSTDLLEALRELVRIGALSAPVLSTVAMMVGQPDPPTGQPAAAPRSSRTYPSRPPDSAARPRGKPEVPEPQDSAGNKLAYRRQNESALKLARAGFDVEQVSPAKPSRQQRTADFKIEGRAFDNYAPTTDRARNVWSLINADKVNPVGKTPQATRIVLNLADSSVDLTELQAQFRNYPMPNLEEVIAITREGEIVHLWP